MVAIRDSSDAVLAVGRLTDWEPLGFEAGDNNWYRFVANGPTGKMDPSGLCGKSCGPNVTEWLSVELQVVADWVDATNKLIDATYPVGLDVHYWVSARLAAKITVIEQVAPKMLYWPKTVFSSDDCPTSGGCGDSVTVCGLCVHTSEIGNVVYGFMAKQLGFSETVTHMGGERGGRGAYSIQDRAAVSAGYRMTPDAVCDVFRAGAVRKRMEIVQDIVKGIGTPCSACEHAVQANANHTKLPTIKRNHVWSPPPSGGGGLPKAVPEPEIPRRVD